MTQESRQPRLTVLEGGKGETILDEVPVQRFRSVVEHVLKHTTSNETVVDEATFEQELGTIRTLRKRIHEAEKRSAAEKRELDTLFQEYEDSGVFNERTQHEQGITKAIQQGVPPHELKKLENDYKGFLTSLDIVEDEKRRTAATEHLIALDKSMSDIRKTLLDSYSAHRCIGNHTDERCGRIAKLCQAAEVFL